MLMAETECAGSILLERQLTRAVISGCMRRYAHLRFSRELSATFRRLLREEIGQDLVEYSLLIVLIGLGAIAAVDHLGDALYFVFRRVARTVVSGQTSI